MNLKTLTEISEEGKSTDEIINIIKIEIDNDNSKINVSQSGINSFGYSLIRQDKNEEAVKIFKLNTELYPKGYNTWDSYGEGLLILGEKEKGIEMYKKSLELNPENENAAAIIEKNK